MEKRKRVSSLEPQSKAVFFSLTNSRIWPCKYLVYFGFLHISLSLRIFPCPSSKQRSANGCPLYCVHLPIIVSYNCSREQLSWRHPWASSTPRALCFILRSDHFSVTLIPNWPPLIVLYLWWWFSECYPKQPHVCESWENGGVCARVLAKACLFVRSRGMRALTSC